MSTLPRERLASGPERRCAITPHNLILVLLKFQTGRSPDHALVSRPAEGCTSVAENVLPLDGILIQNPARIQPAAGGQGRNGRSDSDAGFQKAGVLINLAVGLATLVSVLMLLRKRARPRPPFLPPELLEPETPSRIGYLNLGKRQ